MTKGERIGVMAVVWMADILLVVGTVGGVEGLSAVLASIRIGRELWRPGQRVTGRLRSKGTRRIHTTGATRSGPPVRLQTAIDHRWRHLYKGGPIGAHNHVGIAELVIVIVRRQT